MDYQEIEDYLLHVEATTDEPSPADAILKLEELLRENDVTLRHEQELTGEEPDIFYSITVDGYDFTGNNLPDAIAAAYEALGQS